MEVEIKSVDGQGHIILPKIWREKYFENKKAIISAKGDTVEIYTIALWLIFFFVFNDSCQLVHNNLT